MKGHSRLLWNGCWSRLSASAFFTVGRDKQLICWVHTGGKWSKLCNYSAPEPITAIDSAASKGEEEVILIGLESGQLRRLTFDGVKITECDVLDKDASHSSVVNQIRFQNAHAVATAGDDNQVKIFTLDGC